jgi:hypothetical protein
MLQQAVRIEPEECSEDAIEEALQQIGPPPIARINPPTKNDWPYWNNILSQLNPKGFPMMKSPEEIAQAGKDTIDALTKSSAALTEGCSEISQHVMTLTHKSVAAHLATGKEILDIKTPSDLLEFQSKWASECMTSAITQMTHLSQLSTKVMSQTCEPLKNHFAGTFGKMGGFI